ncbi:hypothetical protein H8959_013851 [Pygathrix nigripes]
MKVVLRKKQALVFSKYNRVSRDSVTHSPRGELDVPLSPVEYKQWTSRRASLDWTAEESEFIQISTSPRDGGKEENLKAPLWRKGKKLLISSVERENEALLGVGTMNVCSVPGIILGAKFQVLRSPQITHIHTYIYRRDTPMAYEVGDTEDWRQGDGTYWGLWAQLRDSMLALAGNWVLAAGHPSRLRSWAWLSAEGIRAGAELGSPGRESGRVARPTPAPPAPEADNRFTEIQRQRLRLAELNAQYRARFGFPFVLAARFSDRAAVSRELARRLLCPSAQELRTALGEVKKIGSLRLADLLRADPAKL